MQFKIDENLPVEVAELLRQAGHGATTVHDQNLAGKADADVASVCQEERRALVTLDTDFADIRAYPPTQYAGLVVLRLKRQDKSYVLELLTRLTAMLSEEPLAGHLWIVEEWRVRVRS
jgi:predicted nuclease of predicted toxin-antitoxin system